MKTISLFNFLFFTLFLSYNLRAQDHTLQTRSVAGVSYDTQITHKGNDLVLNGLGVRKKYFFNIYTAALYVPSELKHKSRYDIVHNEESKVLKIEILSRFMSKSKMIAAFKEGFIKSTNGNIAPIQHKIDKFLSFITDELAPREVYEVTYEPERGSVIYRNGEDKGHVEGKDFKVALFNIWLGNQPVDIELRNALLNKTVL